MRAGVLLMLIMVAMVRAAPNAQLLNRRESVQAEPTFSSALNQIRSSVVFPMYGNVHPLGFYYVQLNIGQPQKPYYLDPDSGSDLTWLQCDAPCVRCTKQKHPFYRPKNNLVACNDPLCKSLQSSGMHLQSSGKHNCEQCDYEVQYADNGSSLGVLVRDALQLNLTNGVQLSHPVAFGCGYNQNPGTHAYPPLDGILGLGHGKSSILSQLHDQGVVRNVIGHCFGSRGGGFLFFGDSPRDSSCIVWTKMSRDLSTHYSPGYGELILSGRTPAAKNLLTVFDSGSSYTYFNSLAYQALISWMRKELRNSHLKEDPEDKTLPICWKGRKPIRSIQEIKGEFRTFELRFENGGKAKAKFDLPPESYLIISVEGNVCLGILDGSEVGLQNQNLIGDISLQGKLVVYDNEEEVMGWASGANCDMIPKPRQFRH